MTADDPTAHPVTTSGETGRESRWLAPLYRVYEQRLRSQLPPDRLPRHVGIILDGHRRFARAEGYADYVTSYRQGMGRFTQFCGWSAELDIPAVTAWVLSTENLRRPAEELEPYFDVLVDLFGRLPEVARGHGYRLKVIGSLDLLPERLVEAAKQAEEAARSGERTLSIAMGYGGRQEIVDAVRDLVRELAERGLSSEAMADAIDASGIARHLYTADLPDPDLVIRTSGESRLSGFLLWQAAYAEYAFVDVYWPAFRRVDFLRALRDFTRRERRFGS